MIDQSFSPESLRGVWDREARRGRNRLGMYPEVRSLQARAQEMRIAARVLDRKELPFIGPDDTHPRAIAKATASEADRVLTESLAQASELLVQQVEESSFEWGLKKSYIHGDRQIFTRAESEAAFFAEHHLQRIVSGALPTAPTSRDALVGALIGTLDNELPKVVVRVDVARFYESINHDQLRFVLRNSKLDPTPRRLVDQLLRETEVATGSSVGLPTGIGLSAKLAELFISSADIALRDAPGVLYYGRYVDDIVIVVGEPKANVVDEGKVAKRIESELAKLGLSLNDNKSFTRRLSTNGSFPGFEFLGYSFRYGSNQLHVNVGHARITALQSRICRTFDAWDRTNQDNGGRRALLLDRLRLLAGNTQLSNNKRNALVGIYFSNPRTTDEKWLIALDRFKAHRASQSMLASELRPLVDSISFVEGFRTRDIRKFSPDRLKKLKGAWHGASNVSTPKA